MSADAEMEREWLEIEREGVKEQEQMNAHYASVKAVNDAWIAKWPNYCRSCGGWGVHYTPGQYSGPPERCYPEEVDPCDALPDGMCHRCRAMEYTMRFVDKDNPLCLVCGWSCDDGLQE
jgi:hypothetical protein